MTAQPLPERWTVDASWLVQALDPHTRFARLIRMSASDYRTDSFLDDRMMARQPEARICNLDRLWTESQDIVRRPVGWIFHIGHVGSTLLSRMLGEMPGTYAVREPRSLRDLGEFPEAERVAAAQGLGRIFSRPLGAAQKPIVKATSFVSEHAPLLVGPEDAAVFLYASPRQYIATILAGPNSRQELDALAPVRAQRLAAHNVVLDGSDRSQAHRAAAAWLTEMASLQRASAALGDRVQWVEFDAFLADVSGQLRVASQHVGLVASDEELARVVNGPLMTRYSKAPEHDYSPTLRQQLLGDANRRFGADIDRAMDWVTEVAGRSASLAAALDRAV